MYYFTPGPTQSHPRLEEYLADAAREEIFSLSHRSSKFQHLFEEMTDNLRALLGVPNDFHVFLLASGTECMERIVQNVVMKKSFHIVNGAFSERFHTCAVEYKKETEVLAIHPEDTVDFSRLTVDANVDLVAVTQSETSIGMSFSMDEIREVKSKFPNALLALDIVSSAPYFEVDFSVVDMTFFSVQKGFGLPAGLGVLILSPRAIEQAHTLQGHGQIIGSYHSFLNLAHYRERSYTPETPNILGVYLLNKVCRDMLQTGIGNIRSEIDERADMLQKFIEESLSFVVKDVNHRSTTVAAISTPNGSKQFIDFAQQNGFMIGSGYGEQKDSILRIANFPHHDTEQLRVLLSKMSQFPQNTEGTSV